jgi:hypothetical protein
MIFTSLYIICQCRLVMHNLQVHQAFSGFSGYISASRGCRQLGFCSNLLFDQLATTFGYRFSRRGDSA